MKRSDWLVLIIVIIIVIAVAFYLAGEDETKSNDKNEDRERNTFLDRLQIQIKNYTEEIEKEVASLNLSKKEEASLERKITIWLLVFNLLIITISGGIFYWFILNEYSVLNAFLATLGVLGTLTALISMFCFFKILDPNVILNWIKRKIRSRVHANNNFDPKVIPTLEKSIAVKTETRDTLQQIIKDETDIKPQL